MRRRWALELWLCQLVLELLRDLLQLHVQTLLPGASLMEEHALHFRHHGAAHLLSVQPTAGRRKLGGHLRGARELHSLVPGDPIVAFLQHRHWIENGQGGVADVVDTLVLWWSIALS